MSNDQRVIKTIDDFLSAALEVDSGASPTTLERAFAALTGPEAVAVLRSAVPDAVEGLLGALPATTHTLGRVCALAATMRPGVLAAAVWARAADATLAEGVPAHLLAALPAVCAITERRVRTALTARPRSARALCTTAALVEGVLARLGAAGFDAATLTPLHPAVLALRLAAGDVCGALPLAQRAASFVRAAAPQQHAAAVLAFDYYAGVVCAAAGDAPRALACFERVCRAPALAPPSWIALCAYRKYVLAALVVHGALPADAPAPCLPPDPRHRSYGGGYGGGSGYGGHKRASMAAAEATAVMAAAGAGGGVRAVAQADTHVAVYAELAALVGAQRVREVRAFLQQHAAVLRADGNLGLARRVEESLLRHVVRRLGTVFAACTVPDMLRAAQLPAADAPALADAVRALASEGEGVAFADAENTVVRFGVPPTASPAASDGASGSGPAEVRALEDDVRRALATTRALDEKRAASERARPAVLAAASAAAMAAVSSGAGISALARGCANDSDSDSEGRDFFARGSIDDDDDDFGGALHGGRFGGPMM